MIPRLAALPLLLLVLLLPLLLGASFGAAAQMQAQMQTQAQPQAPTLQPFATDGCSLFPDRSPSGKTDWCSCCVAHDLAYWRGGPSEARLKADRELLACVRRQTGSEALADVMFAGVRSGGGPYLKTPYRWGYGWPHGRGYESMSAAEQAQADKLEKAYLAQNPALACPAADTERPALPLTCAAPR